MVLDIIVQLNIGREFGLSFAPTQGAIYLLQKSVGVSLCFVPHAGKAL